jgi:hypothetical protein
MKNVRSGPERDVPKRPEGGELWNIHFREHQQTTQDLIAQAEQREVSNTESKSNAETKAPVLSRDSSLLLQNLCCLGCCIQGNQSLIRQKTPP